MENEINAGLRHYLRSLVDLGMHEDLTIEQKGVIIDLYRYEGDEVDTMCTDFDEVHSYLIIGLINDRDTQTDKDILIDHMYSNIRHRVDEIIDQEIKFHRQGFIEDVELEKQKTMYKWSA